MLLHRYLFVITIGSYNKLDLYCYLYTNIRFKFSFIEIGSNSYIDINIFFLVHYMFIKLQTYVIYVPTYLFYI